MKLKFRRETQDDFVKRLIAECEDLKESRLDRDIVLGWKNKQIQSLQRELEDIKLKTTTTSVLLFFN
jgi:hypothetical protein